MSELKSERTNLEQVIAREELFELHELSFGVLLRLHFQERITEVFVDGKHLRGSLVQILRSRVLTLRLLENRLLQLPVLDLAAALLWVK